MCIAILSVVPVDVNIDLAALLAQAEFDDLVASAGAYYVQAAMSNLPTMAWEQVIDVYCRVWSDARGVDFSQFPIPPAPAIPDDFAAWVDQMEGEFGDMADAAASTRTGIPMF